MAYTLVQSGPLASAGVLYSANVDNEDGITLVVADNGGGSTIVAEYSDDNTAWFSLGSTTAKGRFWYPCDHKYIRFRVSAYVSGYVRVDAETSTVNANGNTSPVKNTAADKVVPTGYSASQSVADWLAANNNFAKAITSIGFAPPDADAEALFARMATQPSDIGRILARGLISALKIKGYWSKLDFLYPMVSAKSDGDPDALLNWVSPSYTCTKVGNPQIVKGVGLQATGSSSDYLDTGFAPASASSPKYVQDSAFLGVYVLDEATENVDDVGNSNVVIRSNFGGTIVTRGNTTASQTFGTAYSSRGFTWFSRQSSASYIVGRNADVVATVTAASATPGTIAIRIGRANVAGASTKKIALVVGGSGLTSTEAADLYTILEAYVQAATSFGTYVLDGTEYQTLEGIGFELQSDSIESDAGGIQESNTTSLPLGLSSSEQTRFAQNVVKVPGGSAFHDFRLAVGLYYRGVSSDGKHFVERLPGQNTAVKQMIDASGVNGIAYLQWSPAPYWKKVVVGGTTYSGSTTTVPDKVADPTGWNTYLRQMLQGGTLDNPDKIANPTGYAAWMDAFSSAVLQDMEYVHTNVGRIIKYSPQNEPSMGGAGGAGYPSCVWSDDQMYDFLKVMVPKIRKSVVLSTYAGKPNRIQIYMDSDKGQTGRASAYIKADATLLSEVYGWAWHKITEAAGDASFIRQNATTLTTGTSGLPVFFDENEYFDQFVTVGNAAYLTPQYRFANTVAMALMSFVYLNSPIWYWIHIGKPSTGPAGELEGRSLTVWRPVGSAVPTNYPTLAEGSFDFVSVNWNAIKPFLRFMPEGSKRLGLTQPNDNNTVAMAWRRPDGKVVFALLNRQNKPYTFKVSALGLGSMQGYRYTATVMDKDLGTRQVGDFTVPAYSAEFWIQQ
jgi:hypothetical protein